MKDSPFDTMQFCYPWRGYQARVIANLQTHLEDRKLHVVAAPGAGKTVLGLEVMRQIGKPTLILAPSIAIRNQWVDRLVDLFLPDQTRPDWISGDLAAPGLVTVATYQALFTDCNPDVLAKAGVSVVILDEAHHLRNSWWEALDHVIKTLNTKTVSLTATPPYDVISTEWRRYNDLCGPIDAEISIPELVKSGDLAPHQDLVHITQLEHPETYTDTDHINRLLFNGLRADPTLVQIILDHPWVSDTRRHTSDLLSDPQLFSAMLIYLADAHTEVPKYARRVLGVGQKHIPLLTYDWLRILCQGLLKSLPDPLVTLLSKNGALYRERVKLPITNDEDQRRILQNAAEKFYSIRDITRLERQHMGDDLRLAILTENVGANAIKLATEDPDYFRADIFRERYRSMPKSGRLDAGSVFERLRLEPDQPADMAVLTGSMIIVPSGSLSGPGIAARPLPHDARYDRVDLSGVASDRRVSLVSDLVRDGHVRVLIGTRSLLGQGWDLPVINTLILATNVKSFVSSNQVRGRAIRCNPDNPQKVANIWHIATTAPNTTGPEIDALIRRFDTFMHLDNNEGRIVSGFYHDTNVQAVNANSGAQAVKRDQIAEQWQKALITGSPDPHVQHRIETAQAPRGLVRTDAVAQLIPRAGIASGAMGFWATYLLDPISGIAFATGSTIVMIPALRRVKRVIDHGTMAGSLRQTGLALLHAMIQTDRIRTPRDQLKVEAGKTSDGLAYCTLVGATLPEETRFLAMLEEIFAPIDNPRYLIIRESYLGRRLRIAPYPVPKDLAARKDTATAFQDGWNRYVGPARLVYTRTVQGRLSLLQSRTVTLADARKIRRSSIWE
ncbi:DEAD/DEAH box helicase family protein [Parasulfitobacter algicola]|uniref:DEAD/DEAH box helicase family protein n=1 Tax=Parasulfitobacter algicola TaxID=2614809 RepID=A0ABX2IYK5_9RHOB|nr:DEAD/DEAH box helicase family protein [Sulfitobacter algicola]NSX55701.1 DEAD/DEAH box helicase family protein [Sulfitobacter algicola]